MGLDMYLEREHYVLNWDWMPPEQLHQITVAQGGRPRADIDPSRIVSITERVGTWRKANAIHAWFVRECQNGVDECQRTPVEPEQLLKLLNLVNRVLEDPTLKDALLPPETGFFFGPTDDEEWYLQELKETGEILEALQLDRESPDPFGRGQLYYQSSW